VVTVSRAPFLAEEEQDFTGRPAGSPLLVTGRLRTADDAVAKITIKAGDDRGYVGLELSPWSVTSDDDVNFRTASATSTPSEVPEARSRVRQARRDLGQGQGQAIPGDHVVYRGAHRHRG